MVEHTLIRKVYLVTPPLKATLIMWLVEGKSDWQLFGYVDEGRGHVGYLQVGGLLSSDKHKREHRREVCNVFGGYCKSSCRMQDVDVSLVTYCPHQSPWHPTSLRRPFAPDSKKRHIIKPWDQFQRFTHWWFGVAHVQGWFEGESFSIQLSFGTIEENLADIKIQHCLLCSWW